jgi:GNAT superfamily N-acetyltransferase
MTPEIVNYDQRPELWQRFPEVFAGILPEYNLHGDVLAAGYWERLHEIFGRYQLVLVGPDDEIWATARGIPTSWDGTRVGLGPGLDAAIEAGFALHDAGRQPNTLCALGIEVAPSHQGAGLGRAMLQALQASAREAGFSRVIVPARPAWKDRYPLAAIERYAYWTTDGGLPFDPWLRTQVRAGGTLSVPTPRSSLITGTVVDWESWTRMRFPDSDDYVIPGGLATVRIDRDADLGTYWEPSVWVIHESRVP